MQGQDIKAFFEKFSSIKNHCKGIVSIDNVPKKLKIKDFVVINTDTSTEPGQHWFCLIKIKQNKYEVFDSLSFTSEKIDLFKTYVKLSSGSFIYNLTPVQSSESTSCGFFVIYFVIQRMHNFDMKFEEIINEIFSDNVESNEQIVKDFFLNFN